ncbi:AAA domain protein [Burkholderia cepacia]|uniref:AAA family ATPase n=1 Tax=Burkholderia cepacia TaxID=292 RepID=UPI00298F72F1|nr:AAA family ATPase [Burkholderia cepacia]MDW9231840.1 AAA domain protein [Burkholderia cepacia]
MAPVDGKLFLLVDEDRADGSLALEPSTLAAWASNYEQLQTADEFVEKFGDFVLSLSGRDAYREVVSELAGVAQRLLAKAHDIAVLNAYHPNAKSLIRARAFATFRSILLKGDEELFAFVAIRSILSELARRSPLTNAASIEADVPVAADLDLPVTLNFGEALHSLNPINVIIGSNGQGKTRLLIGLAHAAQSGTLSMHDDVGTELLEFGPPKIVAFTYEASHWRRLRRKGIEVESMGIDSASWRRVTWLIHQIASTDDGQDNLRQIELILGQFIYTDELFLPLIAREFGGVAKIHLREFIERLNSNLLAAVDLTKAPIMKSRTKGGYSLSSGEKSLLSFCLSTFLLTRGGALVLIDEPENHLHPAFISLLVRTLVSTLVATESRAVVVTHSPFVVREVDRSAVLILKRNAEGLPELYRPSLQTLGGDVSMIVDHVFQDGSIKKAYERRIDAVIAERVAQGAEIVTNELERDLGNDGARYLHAQAVLAKV